jgi:fatty acid desaturase
VRSASPYDFTKAKKELLAAFGEDAIQDLHETSPWLDGFTLAFHWSLFFALVLLLGTLPPLGPSWILCFVAQGFVVMAFGYVLHDFFVHRFVGGKTFSYWMGLFTGFVAYLLRTPYAETHYDHHLHTGTDPDEAYKDDLDTRWKRLLFLTPVGYLLAFHRELESERAARFPAPEGTFRLDKEARRRARFERKFLLCCWGALLALAVLWPRFVLFGYVLPLFLVLPVANVLRTILEHGETNPGNLFHCATFYRTGPLTRFLFFWDAGDCHLVHHIFPNIPFYRMGKAVDLFRPFLVGRGVRERRSLLSLLHGYYIRNEPHRALWSA